MDFAFIPLVNPFESWKDIGDGWYRLIPRDILRLGGQGFTGTGVLTLSEDIFVFGRVSSSEYHCSGDIRSFEHVGHRVILETLLNTPEQQPPFLFEILNQPPNVSLTPTILVISHLQNGILLAVPHLTDYLLNVGWQPVGWVYHQPLPPLFRLELSELSSGHEINDRA